jgi:ABC-2 type transport system ATP-binding protein
VTSVARATGFHPPPTRSAVAVRLDGISKSFPKQRGWRALLTPGAREVVHALSDVSCDVRTGEFFGLLGENGAGKTTLFKILATLVTPDAGTAAVGDFDVVRSPDRVREVLAPVIADERSLHWRLSARENLRLFATLHGLPKAESMRRVDQLLSVVNIADAADRQVSSFSSGMKQRLLVARALLARPRVLLLDEPTRSLDPISARAFRVFLREDLVLAQGCTVLLATHNAEEAFELCDRVGVLDHGRLIATGEPANLAAAVGGNRVELLIRPSAPSAIAELIARGVVRNIHTARAEHDGWWRITAEIPDGLEGAAETVACFTRAGVAVGRCERVRLGLAELLERILERHAAGNA